ncbi:MAG: hypothetical protein ACE5DP_02085 [Fidelibacterota bacterium]
MSVKDKIIFGLLIILIVAGGYFQYMASEMIKRMDQLNENDKKHVDIVNNEFREDLRKLNLQFIGRGKHLRKAQLDIIANTNLINDVADSLGIRIDNVKFDLELLDRRVTKKFDNLETDLSDLEDSFHRTRRSNSQRFLDLDQSIQALRADIEAIKEKVAPKEKKK